jgi:hypothetical protein
MHDVLHILFVEIMTGTPLLDVMSQWLPAPPLMVKSNSQLPYWQQITFPYESNISTVRSYSARYAVFDTAPSVFGLKLPVA